MHDSCHKETLRLSFKCGYGKSTQIPWRWVPLSICAKTTYPTEQKKQESRATHQNSLHNSLCNNLTVWISIFISYNCWHMKWSSQHAVYLGDNGFSGSHGSKAHIRTWSTLQSKTAALFYFKLSYLKKTRQNKDSLQTYAKLSCTVKKNGKKETCFGRSTVLTTSAT